MNRHPVTSSNIGSIGYDLESKTLEIEFHSGDIYQYFNVPESIYNGLIFASSHGSYLAQNIKGTYRYRKIG